MKSKKTAAYETLKNRIIGGKLIPGLAINENELAKDLKVSKTPVREALRQLEREAKEKLRTSLGRFQPQIRYSLV